METLVDIFTDIYNKNSWSSKQSVSGPGSELIQTKKLILELRLLFLKYGIKSILDIPCGDFNWMKEVDLSGIDYLGSDIVRELVIKNTTKYPNFKFTTLDITCDDLPKVDLVIVRDCFVHFSNQNILKSIDNIKKSGSRYLLTTSFTSRQNYDIKDGEWRPLNLLSSPFQLNPQYLINENCTESGLKYSDKCQVLFNLENLSI